MPKGKCYFTKIHEDAILPTYGTPNSAACDLYLIEDTSILAGTVALARTGIVAKAPIGYHWELVLRSSTPMRYPGLIQANGIGIIDSDYCGAEDEIKIPLLNTNTTRWLLLKKGTRVAQLILRENFQPEIEEVPIENWNSNSRGGFGSTGE